MQIDGEAVDPEETYSVATFRRPGDPERDLGNCGFPFRMSRPTTGRYRSTSSSSISGNTRPSTTR